MIWKTAVLVGLAVCAVCHEHAISEQKVVMHIGHHGELGHIGEHKPEHHEEYAWSHPSYEFSYRVEDPHTHDFKGQHEQRHGDEVKGMYWLIQPDGYKRTVNYHADKHSGFKADVHYEKTNHPVHHNEAHRVPHKPHVEQHVHIEHKEHHVPELRMPERREPELRMPERREPEIRMPERRESEIRMPERRELERREPERREPERRMPEREDSGRWEPERRMPEREKSGRWEPERRRMPEREHHEPPKHRNSPKVIENYHIQVHHPRPHHHRHHELPILAEHHIREPYYGHHH